MDAPVESAMQAQRSEIAQLLSVLRRRWLLLVAGPALAAIAAFVVTGTIEPSYRASATILVNQVENPGSLVYNDVLTSERLTKTYRELITKRPILEEVVDSGAFPGLTVDELQAKLDTSVVSETQLITVGVTDREPRRAAWLANAVAEKFVEDDNRGQLPSSGDTRVVESASVPSSPFSPNLKINLSIATLAGLMLACGVAFVMEHLDDTVKSPMDVATIARLPVLSEVARWRRRVGDESFDRTMDDAYALLRTNLQFSTLGSPARVILLTSANPGEGKSTTASRYAIAIAEAGKSVVLVDCYLRRPSVHKMFALQNDAGVTTALLRNAVLHEDALRTTSYANLKVMPSGPLPPNPAELLEWSGFDQLIEQLKARFDIVVLDSPPVLGVADARILAARADATVIVIEQGRTRTNALRASVDAVTRANAKVAGVVLNKIHSGANGGYTYQYHAAYGYRAQKGEANGASATVKNGAWPALVGQRASRNGNGVHAGVAGDGDGSRK